MRFFSWVLPLLCAPRADTVTIWTDATAAMDKMEEIVKRQADALQALYVAESEGTASSTCGASNMCDATWAGGSSFPQFLNRGESSNASGTCTRIDLTAAGDITSRAGGPTIGGRLVVNPPNA